MIRPRQPARERRRGGSVRPGPRVIAWIIDALINVQAAGILVLILGFRFRFPYELVNVIILGTCLTLLLHVWCVVRFGGSPGKLAMQLRIVAIDGAPLRAQHAVLRVAPGVLFGITTPILTTVAWMMSGIDSTSFAALSGAAREDLLTRVMPIGLWFALVIARYLFSLFDIVLAYKNADHRSLRDILAGTVVVYRIPYVVGDLRASPSGSTSAMR